MSSSSTTTELRKMSISDLERELRVKSTELAKIRLGVEMRHEKDTAKLRRMRREIARMKTVMRQVPASPKIKAQEGLKADARTATVPASRRARAAKATSGRRSHLPK